MKPLRILPPGSMRRQRRRGRIEGAVGMLILLACIGAALFAATPVELYRSARPTNNSERGAALHFARAPLPPCNDASAKDCMAAANPVVRPIPEPATAVLVGTVLAGLAVKRARQ